MPTAEGSPAAWGELTPPWFAPWAEHGEAAGATTDPSDLLMLQGKRDAGKEHEGGQTLSRWGHPEEEGRGET